jgi:predicted short-subunit dehydrogenase-like oxidoreductase (DUF2520 family)
MGIALASSGYEIVAAVSHQRITAKKAARRIGTGVLALGVDQLPQLPFADTIVIATPDDAIEATANKIGALEGFASARIVLLHVSGSLPSTVLRAAAPAKWAVGSLHPLLAVSDPVAGARAMSSGFFGVEGEARAVRTVKRMVKAMGGTPIPIHTEQKSLYHAAAVMAAGHAVSLFDLAVQMLVRSGPSRRTAAAILHSLMRSAIADLDHVDPAAALTGPFARGDVATVLRNLSALSDPELNEARDAYVALARHAIALSEGRGLDRGTAGQLRRLL